MIITKLRCNHTGVPYKCQSIDIKCDTCSTIYNRRLDDLCRLRSLYDLHNEYICRHCKSKIPATLEYYGKEILDTLKRNDNGLIIQSQKVRVQCSECNNIKLVVYHYHKINRIKSNNIKYKCISCIGSENCRNNTKEQKGKTYETLYGTVKSLEIKDKLRDYNINHRDYSLTNYHTFVSPNKGKTFEEMHGIERANELRLRLSIQNTGSNNPMFGKPTPTGSGNGWSGWYNGWYFRSLLELSCMINYIEANNMEWKSAECRDYRIQYIHGGVNRTYTADFILEDKIMIEVKPHKLRNSNIVKLKEAAAIDWCSNNNMKYKIITERDFTTLSTCDIIHMYDTESITFIDRYKIKMDQLKGGLPSEY